MQRESRNQPLDQRRVIRGFTLASFIICFSIFVQAETCPVTIPATNAIDSAPKYRGKDQWYGSDALAALIPDDGQWQGDPDNNYRRRLWWWRDGFIGKEENSPLIEVSAVRLDDPLTIVPASKGASSKDEIWDTMFVLMRFPEPGCWKITGKYQGQNLSFTVLVGE